MSKFGDAFAAARKAGKKEFTFKTKRGMETFHTRTEEDEAKGGKSKDVNKLFPLKTGDTESRTAAKDPNKTFPVKTGDTESRSAARGLNKTFPVKMGDTKRREGEASANFKAMASAPVPAAAKSVAATPPTKKSTAAKPAPPAAKPKAKSFMERLNESSAKRLSAAANNYKTGGAVKPKPITTKPSNEPVTGGSNTPMTPDRREILRATAAENAKNRGMMTRAKGGMMYRDGARGPAGAGTGLASGRGMMSGRGPMMAKGGSMDGCAMKGKTKGAMVKMAKGGSIDGCAVKGKTKATMVKMANGGMMKGKKGC